MNKQETSEYAEEMWKKATKLKGKERFRIVYDFAMAIMSVVHFIMEKDSTWLLVVFLWCVMGLQDLLDTKMKKGLEAIVSVQNERLNFQDKFIEEFLREQNVSRGGTDEL